MKSSNFTEIVLYHCFPTAFQNSHSAEYLRTALFLPYLVFLSDTCIRANEIKLLKAIHMK